MLGSSWDSVLDACRVGADWSWRLVYQEVAPSLLRYHRSRGTREAEDLIGDTFVRVVRALDGFEGNEDQFRAWVFAISHRRAIDLARASARRPERPASPQELIGRGETGNSEDEALRSLGDQRTREMLERLTPDQRDVLLLRILSDLTVEQVSVVLGKTPGAVKALQARGLEQIRRQISREAVTL